MLLQSYVRWSDKLFGNGCTLNPLNSSELYGLVCNGNIMLRQFSDLLQSLGLFCRLIHKAYRVSFPVVTMKIETSLAASGNENNSNLDYSSRSRDMKNASNRVIAQKVFGQVHNFCVDHLQPLLHSSWYCEIYKSEIIG